MCKANWQISMLVTILCLVILCARAYRKEEVYKRIYGVVPKKVETSCEAFLGFPGYKDLFQHAFRRFQTENLCHVKTFQGKHSNYILLDFRSIINKHDEKHLHGLKIVNYVGYAQHEPLKQIEALLIFNIENPKHSSDGRACVLHNISRMHDSQDTINTVTRHSCHPWNIRHLIKGAPHPFLSVINIFLLEVPIVDLLIEDLINFPNLRELLLNTVPVTSDSLEKELICTSPYLEVFSFSNSLGYLQKFPSHIFNCSQALNITLISLKKHNVASLPAYAFQSAAQSVKVLTLIDLGLETIHKDAFFGVFTLEEFYLAENRLTSPVYTMIPPSEELKELVVDIGSHDSSFKSNLDLNMLELDKRKHLRVLEISWTWSLSIKGRFCSFESQSNLKMLVLKRDSFKSLFPPLFDDCISLKYLHLGNNTLEYLDEALFARNVSLEMLDLSHNKLTDNTFWSGLLAQQHQLQYLNLSWNSLTSWTQRIGAVWQLKQLDISHNNMVVINPEAFKNLTRLELLSLEGNIFYESNFLCLIPFLHAINLAGNLLNSVDCLHRMRNAYLIDVSSNNISELVLGARKSCPGYQCQDITLHAEHNMLISVRLQCSDIQHYRVVDLSNNKLTDFLSIFPDVRNVTCSVDFVNVSGNSFSELVSKNNIRPVIVTLEPKQHSVDYLDMSHCSIQGSSTSFGWYIVFKNLDLKYNMLESFTPINFHPSTRYLDDTRPKVYLENNPLVCDCKMHWLKENLQRQANSTTVISVEYSVSYCIDIFWNKSELIQSFPDDMFLCQQTCSSTLQMKCKHIGCYIKDQSGFDAVKCSGYISGLSSALDRIKSQIYINDGHIPTLELTPTIVSGLKYLNLTACHIINISSEAFSSTPHLQSLVLPYNLIQYVSKSTLTSLVKLRILDLSNNLLQSIEANIFLPLWSLETALLHSNKLTDLNQKTLNVLQRLKNISLYNNPWECSCNSSFKLWIVEREKILNEPRRIQCNGSGSPVMLSNLSCTQSIYISTGLTSSHVAILSTLVGFLIVCTILYNKYRFELSVLLFTYMPNCFKYQDNEDGPCGIFAVYEDKAHAAYMWVKDDLVPHIEPACPLICYDRDFLPGIDMMDNIEDAINRTNCAVVLFTDQFLQNHWSIAMFEGIFTTMMERQRPYKIIPVLGHGVNVTDITSHANCPADLRVLLKTHLVLDLSKNMFWECLLYLLPDSCKVRIRSDPDNGERDVFFIQSVF